MGREGGREVGYNISTEVTTCGSISDLPTWGGGGGGWGGGYSISTEVTQPVVALVTCLLGRAVGVEWGGGGMGWGYGGVKLQTLIYDIFPSTTTVFSYVIGS